MGVDETKSERSSDAGPATSSTLGGFRRPIDMSVIERIKSLR